MKQYKRIAEDRFISVAMRMIVCHEGAQEDEVLRAAMLHKR